MGKLLDSSALLKWAALALDDLSRRREAIDALNVFPVPDGDTGTNMFLTWQSGVEAMADVSSEAPEPSALRLAALAKGALLGARGNSGVILSEILRGVAATRASDLRREMDGTWLADALTSAATRAYSAVSHPQEGTVLTVVRQTASAAAAAAQASGGDLMVVAQAAAAAARSSLAATTGQLEALRRAGVVDAGGRGFVVLTDALLEIVSGEHRDLPEFERVDPATDGSAQEPYGYAGPAYEVMYLLDAEDDDVPGLKAKLADLGDSLVVVGGDGLWNVHVHCDDAGAAIEAALAVGAPHRIRITYLEVVSTQSARHVGRALVVVTHGQGVTDLLEASGVTTVRAPLEGRPSTAEMLAGILNSGAGEVILLPSDKDSLPVAEAAAVAAREQDHRVAVIPTRSIVQSLSAVAVHNPSAAFDDDVVAMTRSAASTRYAGLTTAIRDAWTTAGECRIGDELGVVGGDIAVIGSDLQIVAESVLNRMLNHGGELVTVVLGADAPDGFVEAITNWAQGRHPGVEVIGYEGGQPNWPAIIGVE